jgi:homoprotocatechuate degradation regulator HpaR
MLLLRARESVMRLFRASLREHGITEQQWRVLRALDGVAEIEVTDLARLTFLHAPSLSRILPDLEERGLVLRRSDTADLRKSLVAISREGASTIAAVTPSSEAIYAEIAERFGSSNLARLQDLLVDLENSMAKGREAAEPRARTRPR